MLRRRERERSRDAPASDAPRDRPLDERRERRPDDQRRPERRPNGHAPAQDAGGGSRMRGSSMPGSRAVARAKAHLAELTGGAAEGVSGLARTNDGWRVVLETVEVQRVPRTTDIMASYAVDLDGRGELVGYQRVARYYRSDVDGER